MAIDLTTGSARVLLDNLGRQQIDNLQSQGVLIPDPRRKRPRYFDGRFLAARDLIREQNYFLTRQADLGRAGGFGVVSGLMVTGRAGPAAAADIVDITPGHGITPAGELVMLSASPTTVHISDIVLAENLDVSFGLLRKPIEPARNRSGLFILGLRPVEYTANPIASYPTSIDGRRSVEDGDIIEAVAITLTPFHFKGDDTSAQIRRAQTAHAIFLEEAPAGVPADVLPLAMLSLSRGHIEWVDPWLVRREVGAEHSGVVGFGIAPRALREAELLQYDQQLGEIAASRADRNLRFAASDYFRSLPPAGRMPAAAINPADFTQIYFPQQINVALSVVPDDELSVLIEESLLLPPIDLALPPDDLDNSSVLVVVPMPRARIKSLFLRPVTRVLRPAAPGLVARQRPIDLLRGLIPAALQPAAAASPSTAINVGTAVNPTVNTTPDLDAAWRQALAAAPFLWYVRRRALEVTTDAVMAFVTPTAIAAPTPLTNLSIATALKGVPTIAGAATIATALPLAPRGDLP